MMYPWQQAWWNIWQQRRQHVPHALLWYGMAGIGKSEFIRQVAHSALCEQPQPDGHACQQCTACTWLQAGNHPDLRHILPQSQDSTSVIPKLRLEQILALHDFLQLTPHRHLRVIVIQPADALNLNAANALLKMLEEPPPATLFLLVANHLGQVLPTIRSRCQRHALPRPNHQDALQWLQAQNCPNPEQSLAAQAGAPLRAQTQPFDAVQHAWLEALAHPAQLDVVAWSGQWHALPLTDVLHLLWRWVYDVLQQHLCGQSYFFPHLQISAHRIATNCHATALSDLAQRLLRDQAVSTHPLNARLCIEAWLLDYLAVVLPRTPSGV